MSEAPLRTFKAGEAQVEIYSSKRAQGEAAALRGAELIRSAVSQNGRARVIIATGNSQEDMISAMAFSPMIDWARVEVFHMDEYLGMSADHPASFRRWLRDHLLVKISPAKTNLLQGDAPDTAAEIRRYTDLLAQAAVDVCFLGIGENGHIAFNDPHVADFNDPETVKVVTLDDRCRSQQVGEGHFASLDEVPRQALTLTCPALIRCDHIVCCVPEARKAEAVYNTIYGEIDPGCPGTLLRTHGQTTIYLDQDSAKRLPILAGR